MGSVVALRANDEALHRTMQNHIRVTQEQYTVLDSAYRYFNIRLFGSSLPECVIVFQRKPNMRGYYWQGKMSHRYEEAVTDELALNPDTFNGRTDMEILSTLAHEINGAMLAGRSREAVKAGIPQRRMGSQNEKSRAHAE